MNFLKQLRTQRGLTQGQVMEETGIPQSTLSLYENYTPIKEKHMKALADFYNIAQERLRVAQGSSVFARLRQERGVSMAYVSKHVRATLAMVRQWDHGQVISEPYRERLGNLFRVDPDMFIPEVPFKARDRMIANIHSKLAELSDGQLKQVLDFVRNLT